MSEAQCRQDVGRDLGAETGNCMCMQEYKIHNAEVLFREDSDMDDLIDVIEGNRRYIKCL